MCSTCDSRATSSGSTTRCTTPGLTTARSTQPSPRGIRCSRKARRRCLRPTPTRCRASSRKGRYRAAFSNRQLFERMVEFWSDHFNIAISKVGYLKALDDRDVIRAHALGKFSDLLSASAHSPAMLAYLDQNLSRVGAPNQNYARELMELHTLGVNGGR